MFTLALLSCIDSNDGRGLPVRRYGAAMEHSDWLLRIVQLSKRSRSWLLGAEHLWIQRMLGGGMKTFEFLDHIITVPKLTGTHICFQTTTTAKETERH